MRRIPREFLHLDFEDLADVGVPNQARAAVRRLLADLPLVPEAGDSALLVGPREVALPCLVVLARHVVQGLRDHNLTLAHDRARLRAERRKLVFMDAEAVLESHAVAEAVLCVLDATDAIASRLLTRRRNGLATFVASGTVLPGLADWRLVQLA